MNDVETISVEHFTFARTLERALVNRRAVSEVFVTDFQPVSDTEWVVGAQLPLSHAYYSDHTSRPQHYDLLLLLECCRQAGTYGGYAQFGSPLDTVNMVSSLQLHITDPQRLGIASKPGHLVIHVRAIDVIRSGGRTKGATPEMTLTLDGEVIGSASIPVSLASPKLFRALRGRMRDGPPVLTSSLRPTEAEPIEPSAVGRSRPANVLIAGVRRTDGAVHAELCLRPDNFNILDHDYDHIPAMALADAAVQLMTWDTGRPRHTLSALQAAFSRFTEVDERVVLVGAHDGSGRYEVSFFQAGSTTGKVTLTPHTFEW